MIKRILVALDPDTDTPIATRYAAELAARFGGEVSGLAVIDTRRIAAEAGPGGAVGAGYYLELSRKRMTDEARDTARRLVTTFDAALREAGVRHAERVEEGGPVEEVIEATKYHDLLVIGRTPHFFYTRPEEKTNTLAQVVKKGITPTLVVGEAYRPVERVLIAYDGSAASARSMQRFAQLQPFGSDVALELVHVRLAGGSAERMRSALLLRLARSFLLAHGFERVSETSRNGGTPVEVLSEHARDVGADLVVAGAHSVSAMRRLAFGSTTHALLKDGTLPFFLFH